MPTSNLLAALARTETVPRIAWGVRASAIDWADYGLMARASFGLTRLAARRADLIIANSEAGRRFHAAQGYPADRMIVIPNGIEVRRFRPDPEARASVRAAWGVAAEQVVIGAVARLDPMKDHVTLLRAFAMRDGSLADALLVCAGSGSADKRAELGRLAESLGIGGQVRWLEATGPVERLYCGFDLHTSASSFGEGFSNAVAEAMACGVPCVATDAGDAALLIGQTGQLVPVRSPEALAAGWHRLLSADHRALGLLARERIVAEFSAERLVLRSEAALQALAREPRTAP
jgi:glycosyltransferase involved in cell wall biosynthesis